MADLLPVGEARARILAGANPLGVVHVPIAHSVGRVLAHDLVALRTQPATDVSAMDGYAVRSSDTAGTLEVVGESAAGRPSLRGLGVGEAIRIFTGAALPEGADAVIVQEDVQRTGSHIVVPATKPGRHVRRRGLDFEAGTLGLSAGTILTPRAAALAAAMNFAEVPVYRAPRVAIFSTGDELVAPGAARTDAEVVSTNALALNAMLQLTGAEVTDLGIVPDTRAATLAAIEQGATFDVLLSSGGASVGDHDHVAAAWREKGLALRFWKIAMRPGKPMMMGHFGSTHVLGLPGNPVSSYVCAILFVLPLVRALAGQKDPGPVYERVRLGASLPENDHRTDHLRACLVSDGDGCIAMPSPVQDSSMIRTLALADCLIVREPHAKSAKAGDWVQIIRL